MTLNCPKCIIGLFIWGIILTACSSEPKPNNSKDDVILMPYFQSDYIEYDHNGGSFGYVNAETFEIVIPTRYLSAGPFVGDFAWISNIEDSILGRREFYSVINKHNRKVLSHFDRITLFDSDDGKQVFALTGKYSKIKTTRIRPWGIWFLPPMAIEREYTHTKHRLYNLSTGKLVLTRTSPIRHDPKIELFSNYIKYDDELHEILKNGQLKKIDDEELVAGIIAREKQTQELDLGAVVQNLPGDLRLEEVKRPVSRPGFRFYQVDRFSAVLYEIDLVSRTGEKFTGLYDALQNKWAIPPMIKVETIFHFYYTGYSDWICYYFGQTWNFPDFYNIKTRKKYKYLYGMNNNWAMTYMGHNLNESNRWYHSEFIVEDF